MAKPRGSRERDLALMALVARKYYLADQSKTDIARELYLSRFQVARLLERSRREGIVRIDIGMPGPIDLGLATELREELALQHALVIDVADTDYYTLLHELSRATMMALSEIVTETDVLGLASARVLLGLSESVESFVTCPVVQLTGALSPPDATDIIHNVRKLAQAGGGRSYSFYAPLIASDESAKAAYLRQPDVQRALSMVADVSVAVLGVGKWAPGLSTVFDSVSADEQKESTRDGVAVEAGGILLNRDGRPVHTALTRRLIAPSFQQLEGARVVVGAVFMPERADAVRIAIRGGLINGIITNRAMAQQLLHLNALG